jgi:hypothetical protein
MKANAFGGNTSPEEDEEESDGEGDNPSAKSPADTTSAKKSKGKQADDLDNPVKGKNNPNKKH